MMTWDILWALILGFWLHAIIQAVVSKEEMSRLLPDDSPRTIVVASGLGAASSSCSYAAVALARSMFRKGANFTAAMAFQFASTNLVLELGILLAVLMGWQFTLAEFVGGPLMILVVVLLFKVFVMPKIVEAARREGQQGAAGAHGRARGNGYVDSRGHDLETYDVGQGAYSDQPFLCHGLGVALGGYRCGAAHIRSTCHLGAGDFWRGFFLQGHPIAARLWGPFVGPIVAIVSFVCSVGNVLLAAVLWNGGISFGGVVAFIFADLPMTC